MKKKIVLFGISVLAISFLILPYEKAQAQARIGIKGGINFANMKYEPQDQTEGVPDANSFTSYHVGLIADLPIAMGLSLQPGIMLNSKGSKFEYNSDVVDFTKIVNPIYIDVPVNVLFKPQLGDHTKFYVGLGPYIGFGVGGKVSYDAETPLGDAYKDHDIEFGSDNGDDLKAVDVGGNVLAGFEFGNGLILGAQYGLSFTNNAPEGDNDDPKILRNKELSVSIGYLF